VPFPQRICLQIFRENILAQAPGPILWLAERKQSRVGQKMDKKKVAQRVETRNILAINKIFWNFVNFVFKIQR